MEGGRDNANNFKKAVQENSSDIQVIVKETNNEIIHIADIDADIEEEALKEEIEKSTADLRDDEVRVLSMRPMQNGNKAATVLIRKDVARDLHKKSRIKIGWVLCRCFKCLQFGHSTKDCKGEDRSSMCLNCGAADHKVKVCKNQPFCLACKEIGHRGIK